MGVKTLAGAAAQVLALTADDERCDVPHMFHLKELKKSTSKFQNKTKTCFFEEFMESIRKIDFAHTSTLLAKTV